MFDELVTDPDAGVQLHGEDILAYILGGNAIFTIESIATGDHYTYRVRSPEDKPWIHWVSLLTGPTNTHDYTYLFTVYDGRKIKLTTNSKLPREAKPVAGFIWMLKRLTANQFDQLSKSANIYHHGTCGRCGRVLSVPESVKAGLGPHCRELLGI